MNIHLKTSPESRELVIVAASPAALKKHAGLKQLKDADRGYIIDAVEAEKQWTTKSSLVLPLPLSPTRRVLVVGTGEESDQASHAVALRVRRVVGLLKQHRFTNAALWLNDFTAPRTKPAAAIARLVTEALLADYTYRRYKSEPKEGWPQIESLTIVAKTINATTKAAATEGEIIANATNMCRDLSNTPGGDMTPETLAGAALAVAEETPKLRVSVLDEPEIQKLGMGGIMGVSRGSDEAAKFIILEYLGAAKTKAPLVYVGKGVTFDTGGLNLKPSSGIGEMHMDMSGGAAVISAVAAIAKMKLNVNVIGLVPAVENMPSGSSYHPGDVLKAYNGKTMEVLNTDAEGRLILADALAYASQYKPDIVVDVATLTGAAVVALGQRVIGLFTNDDKLEKLGRSVGVSSGDRVWPMPTWDEYATEIQGTFGDFANTGKTRYGGAITAAVFLKQFVDYPWIHLDIAPRMTSIEGDFLAKGAAGAGVRFLIELAHTRVGR